MDSQEGVVGVLRPQFADRMTNILSVYLINPARNIGMVKNDSQEPTDLPRQENDVECHS